MRYKHIRRWLWRGYLTFVHVVALVGLVSIGIVGYFAFCSEQEVPVYEGVICDARTANVWTMVRVVRLIPTMPTEIHVDHYADHKISVIRLQVNDSSQRCAFICRSFAVKVHHCTGKPPLPTDVPMHKIAMR